MRKEFRNTGIMLDESGRVTNKSNGNEVYAVGGLYLGVYYKVDMMNECWPDLPALVEPLTSKRQTKIEGVQSAKRGGEKNSSFEG